MTDPAIIIAALALIGTALTGIPPLIKAFGDHRTTSRQVEAAAETDAAAARREELKTDLELHKVIKEQVDEQVKERLDEFRREIEDLRTSETTRTRAMGRILRAIANQWPSGDTGPNLDPADIAAIEDTIPPQWIRRGPLSPSGVQP